MPKATLIPLCFFKSIRNFQLRLIDLLNDHLGDPVTTAYGIWSFPQIDERNLYLTPVISIDGAWSIDDTDAVLKGKATSRTDLCLKAWRKSDSDPCRNHRYGTYRELLIIFDSCTQIHPGRLRSHVTGQRDI